MKKLLELLATHGGVIVCSSSLSPEQITIANACGRMYVDENGIGFVYMEEYAQSHDNQEGEEYKKVVEKLAEWSRKYPRGKVYPMGKQPHMDSELIEIEEMAKELTKFGHSKPQIKPVKRL